MRLRKERSISIVYDAVSISKDIEVIGGPLTLNFYVESGSYVPNRFLTPLVLKPIVYIVDPNKVIPEGDKSDELIKCNWYEDGEKIVSGDDYKINKDNSLTVLKNSTKDLTISFSATWLDPRKKQEITIEESVDLVCVQLAGDTSNPVLKLDKPLNWIHNPLKNDRIYTIKAYISKDKIYEGAVEWYYSTKGKEPKLIDNTLLAYEGGQYTNELKLNSAYLENCLITAKNLSNDKLKEYYWFFDEDGNPLTYNEPQYKDIEGSNYFEFPEEALTTRAKVRLEGLTLNQLVKNGDFSNGKDYWTLGDNSNLEKISDGAEITISSEHRNSRVYQSIPSNVGDKHYTTCIMKSNSDKIGIGQATTVYHKHSGNGRFEKIDAIDVCSYDKYHLSIVCEREYGASAIVKNITTFNLTQLFGKGNEPSIEWCRKHIQDYFEGLQSIQAPIRIRSEVGRRNLLTKSGGNDIYEARFWTMTAYNSISIEDNVAKFNIHKTTDAGRLERILDLKEGVYSISLWVKGNNVDIEYKAFVGGGVLKQTSEKCKDGYVKYSASFHIPKDNQVTIRAYYRDSIQEGESFYVKYFKLEEGSISTPWTPAPEDNLPATGGTTYITNKVNLSRVGKVFDYIENGKIYKNIKRYYFTKEDKWALREDYKGDNFRYYMTLPFEYKTTGTNGEGELLCNNFTPTSNLASVLTEKESNTIALYREKASTVYLTLDKKVDDVNSMIPEGTFIDVILPETEVINLTTTGKVLSHPKGNVFIDYITKTYSYYIKDKGFKFEGDFRKIISLRSGSGNNNYDLSKIKKVGDNLYTHSDITEDTILTIEYETGPSIYGNNTVSYMSIKEVLDELWLEDVYTYKGTEDSEGNITWEFVRLVDIDNYEEWLTQDKISPYTLAPDGVIFGKYKADTKFLRQFPSSLYVDIIIPNRLKDGSGKVKARALVGTADGIIENPGRYFKITWLRRDIKAGSKDEVIGYGEEILLDIDEKSSISIDVEDLGILKALTDEKGKYLTDENNTILVGR